MIKLPSSETARYLGKRLTKSAREYGDTAFSMLFIINGILVFLVLFDLVDASKLVQHLAGAVALGFSFASFLKVNHQSTKHQLNGRKK